MIESNLVLDTIKNRRSIREYLEKPVSDEVLKHYLMYPGEFLEIIKKGLEIMKKSDNDIIQIELNDFKKFVEEL